MGMMFVSNGPESRGVACLKLPLITLVFVFMFLSEAHATIEVDYHAAALKCKQLAEDKIKEIEADKSKYENKALVFMLKQTSKLAELRANAVENNLNIAKKRFKEFEKLEDQIARLADKYKIPKDYQEIIKVSGGKVVEVRETLERSWKSTLANLDAETSKINLLSNSLKVLRVASAASDLYGLGKDVYEVASATDRSFKDDFNHLISIESTLLPYAVKAAGGPILAAKIGSWVYETSMNQYMDAMRAIGEDRINLLREAEKSFRVEVKFIIDTEILNSKGKTVAAVEASMRRKISEKAELFRKRLDYEKGDLYKIVFGNCKDQYFCSEASMDKLTNGVLTENYTKIQNIIIGLCLPDSPDLKKHLAVRNIPEKIQHIQAFYEAYDDLIIKLKDLEKYLAASPPVIDSLPELSPPQPTDSTISSIKSFIASAQEIPAGNETENTVYFSVTTNDEAEGVIVTATFNRLVTHKVDLSSANKKNWTSMISFQKPGNYTLTAYITDKDGKLIESSASKPISLKVTLAIPSVTNVSVSSDPVVLGSIVKFTATVNGKMPDKAQAFLKLDNKDLPMKPSGNAWVVDVDINEANTDGIRTYTAYVNSNGAVGTMPAPKTLQLKSPITINSVKAQFGGQPVSSCVLNDKIDFFAEITGAASTDKITLMLDKYPVRMTQTSKNMWWVSIPIEQTNGGVRTYTVVAEKGGLTTRYATPKNLTVKLTGATLTGVDAQDLTGKPVDKINLNDQAHFVVTIDGKVNGPVKIKLNDWVADKPLVRQGNSNKWKTAVSIPMQQTETKSYYAFVEVNGQEAAKSPTRQLEVGRADGLQCPATARPGDLVNAELLVDNTRTTVKTNNKTKLVIKSCDGRTQEKPIQFEKAGYGWVWPGYRIKNGDCGEFQFVVETKTGARVKDYTCTTQVSSSAPRAPSPPPASDSSGGDSSGGVVIPNNKKNNVERNKLGLTVTVECGNASCYPATITAFSSDTSEVAETVYKQISDMKVTTADGRTTSMRNTGGSWKADVTLATPASFSISSNSIRYQYKDAAGRYKHAYYTFESAENSSNPFQFQINEKSYDGCGYLHESIFSEVKYMADILSRLEVDLHYFQGTTTGILARKNYEYASERNTRHNRSYSDLQKICNGDPQVFSKALPYARDNTDFKLPAQIPEIAITDLQVNPQDPSGISYKIEATTNIAVPEVVFSLMNERGSKNYKMLGDGRHWKIIINGYDSNLVGSYQYGVYVPGPDTSGYFVNSLGYGKFINNARLVFDYKVQMDAVKNMYTAFTAAYNSKNDAKVLSFISDDWESQSDSTTLSELSTNMRNSFRVFDSVGCDIQNIIITPAGNGKYQVRYDIAIKGKIFRGNIQHSEKSSVAEEVTLDSAGVPKISKTLSGRFWTVQ